MQGLADAQALLMQVIFPYGWLALFALSPLGGARTILATLALLPAAGAASMLGRFASGDAMAVLMPEGALERFAWACALALVAFIVSVSIARAAERS